MTLSYLWDDVTAAVVATPGVVPAGVLPALATAGLVGATWLVIRRATP